MASRIGIGARLAYLFNLVDVACSTGSTSCLIPSWREGSAMLYSNKHSHTGTHLDDVFLRIEKVGKF